MVETFDPTLRYSVADFDDWLPELPATAPAVQQPIGEAISAGSRNDQLYRLGRALKAKGLPLGAIAASLRETNVTTCIPPLDDAEIEALIRNVWGQADRPRPEAGPRPPLALVEIGDLLAKERED